jgi:pseudaminic acid synthase
MGKFIELKGRKIGDASPAFIIAELSCNHLGEYSLAVKTIKAMKEAGADAVKLQTFRPDSITIDCDNRHFMIRGGTLWDGRTLYGLYKEAFMPWEWQPKLKKIAEDLGLIFFSSPFDKEAVDFLERMGVPAYKVASFEITDIPLIEHVASKGKPVIISTGVAALADIREAVSACRREGNHKIALLKCTSAYPTNLKEVNLKTIPDMAGKFKTVVGISDHTLGSLVPAAAVALGAKIIEKHFILDRSLGGPDAAFSLEPDEFKAMVKSVRETEMAVGSVNYKLTEAMKRSRTFARSLFVVKDVNKGEIFTEQNVRSVRPGLGLHPRHLKKILGKKSGRNINKGTPFELSFVKAPIKIINQ